MGIFGVFEGGFTAFENPKLLSRQNLEAPGYFVKALLALLGISTSPRYNPISRVKEDLLLTCQPAGFAYYPP